MRGRFHPDGRTALLLRHVRLGRQPDRSRRLLPRASYGQADAPPDRPRATKQGLQITFTEPIDRASAVDSSNYSVKTWAIKRTVNYGSEHYDEAPLRVSGASISADGRTVSLVLPDIHPTWCMAIQYRLKGSAGEPFEGLIHNTIHRLTD